jgi:methyl-accepting chemotaxis protein
MIFLSHFSSEVLNDNETGTPGTHQWVQNQQKGNVMERPYKRRRFPIVDRSLQYRFLAMILVYCLMIVVFLAVFLFVPDIIRLQDEGLSIELKAAAADKILLLHSRVWPAVMALICILGLHSFRAFHRVVGPLYRFRWAFDQIRNGDLSLRVKIRRKDYLHREAAVMNQMIETLAAKVGDIQQAGFDSLKSLAGLEQAVSQGTAWKEGDTERLHALRRNLETLMNSARYFQVENVEPEKDGNVHVS